MLDLVDARCAGWAEVGCSRHHKRPAHKLGRRERTEDALECRAYILKALRQYTQCTYKQCHNSIYYVSIEHIAVAVGIRNASSLM